ncbi:MAG: pyrroline-5-carboxylate reductase family protein, partial [Burkholderiaceae bacterium]
MQSNLKITFIGGGNMAQALIGGLAGKLTDGSNIHVVDVIPETLTQLTARFGVTT